MSARDYTLKLIPDRLEFADSGTPETLKVCLENTSPKITCFKIRLKAGDANKFRVMPVTGAIKPNDKIDVKVVYRPDGRRAIDTKLQIKHVQLEEGQTFRATVFEQGNDSVKTMMLPFIFTDLEIEADHLYRTPKASTESPAAGGQWWRKGENK